MDLLPATPAAAIANRATIPFDYIWRPGTPLPKLQPDQMVVAWPTQTAMAKLKNGQSFRMTAIGHATADGRYIMTASQPVIASVTNRTSGLVNLTVTPLWCGLTGKLVKRLGTQWGAVGTTFSQTRPVTQAFDYDQGQSSSLGVGISTTGKPGSLTADGTTSVSTTSDQSFPANDGIGNERYYTQFAFGKFKLPCTHGETEYQVKPYEWAGGDWTAHPKSAPRARYCVVERANRRHSVTFTKSTTTAVTFSSGFTFYGFTGTVQTGYDTSAKVRFTWAPDTAGHLRGTADYPADAARELVARK
jgi:hypothetical protein